APPLSLTPHFLSRLPQIDHRVLQISLSPPQNLACRSSSPTSPIATPLLPNLQPSAGPPPLHLHARAASICWCAEAIRRPDLQARPTSTFWHAEAVRRQDLQVRAARICWLQARFRPPHPNTSPAPSKTPPHPQLVHRSGVRMTSATVQDKTMRVDLLMSSGLQGLQATKGGSIFILMSSGL
ncbi:unnamed protein product, partial [Urochloa humidicola]